jgi:uncharacterized coiled-coil protein SlyX
MNKQIEHRLKELQSEFAEGQKMLAELEAKQANMRNTLLRISGAIQVLEELIAAENAPAGKGNGNGQCVNEYAEPVSAVQEPAG